MRHFWAVQLWILAAWEAVAIATRRVPTISATCRCYRRHRLARLAILFWATALTSHLLRSKA